MDSISFEELSQNFTDKLTGLCEALTIQSCMESTEEDVQAESCQPVQSIDSLWNEVEELSTILMLIRNKCTEQRNALGGFEVVN